MTLTTLGFQRRPYQANNQQADPLYRKAQTAHCNMLHRCLNPRHADYHNYGAIGITVAEEWTGPNGFDQFIKDVGLPPSTDRNIQIYRENNTGSYVPGNVSWAERAHVMKHVRRRQSRAKQESGKEKI